MNFQIGKKKIDNPFTKILLSILAIFIVIVVLGFVGLVLSSVAVFVVIVLIFVALVVPIAAVFGAGKWMKGIRGSGDILTEIRDVKEFRGISLGLACEVEIEQADEQEVTIETDDNVLGYILSYVQEGMLNINTKNNLSPSRKILLKITTNQLDQLIISGSAKVQINQIKSEKLAITVSGAGTIVATGQVDDLNIVISGVGNISFKELKTKNTRLKISGSGRADLFVSENLDASINGTGKANIWGSPTNVTKSINGLGKIKII